MKTAKELGISKEIHEGLQLVRDALREGKLQHMPHGYEDITCGFNMGNWYSKTHCGSVGCIGGWTDHLMKLDRENGVSHACASVWGLERLCYPNDAPCDYAKLTPAMAADAIDNFLNTGIPHWRRVYTKHRAKDAVKSVFARITWERQP